MPKQKQVYSSSIGIILVSILSLYIYSKYYPRTPVPVITDVHIINLERATKRWNRLQLHLKNLRPLPIHRWNAVDGHTLSEEEMKASGIPETMMPSHSSVEEGLKKRRKGEIGCWLSHVRLLKYLSTLQVPEDAGHLILEDDVVIDPDTLNVWRSTVPYLPNDWGMFYFGAGGEHLQITDIQHGFGVLKKGWGAYGYVVRHSMIPTILQYCQSMTEPIDLVYQNNYSTFRAYCLVSHTIYPTGGIEDSTIWNGHTG
jgi:GR25 family glycosyltransferase involved in LPS biosynthesis